MSDASGAIGAAPSALLAEILDSCSADSPGGPEHERRLVDALRRTALSSHAHDAFADYADDYLGDDGDFRWYLPRRRRHEQAALEVPQSIRTDHTNRYQNERSVRHYAEVTAPLLDVHRRHAVLYESIYGPLRPHFAPLSRPESWESNPRYLDDRFQIVEDQIERVLLTELLRLPSPLNSANTWLNQMQAAFNHVVFTLTRRILGYATGTDTGRRRGAVPPGLRRGGRHHQASAAVALGVHEPIPDRSHRGLEAPGDEDHQEAVRGDRGVRA